MTPFKEICTTFKMKVLDNETFEEFAVRASGKLSKCPEATWNSLSDEVQEWANSTIKIRDKTAKKGEEADLPVLEGYPEEPEETAADAEPADEDEATDDEPASEDAASDEDAAPDGDPEPDTTDGEEPVDEAPEEAQDAESNSSAGNRRAPIERRKASTAPAKPPKKEAKTGKDKAVPTSKVRTPAGAKAGRRASIGTNDTIKVLAKENPYREGSLGHKVFEKYRDNLKVKDFVIRAGKLELTRPPEAMLRFDVAKGHVKVVKAA